MANHSANFRPTIERLLKRPTWAVDSGRALVGCMHKGGCDQVIDIELPTTLEQACIRIRAEGWVYEAHNGMHMCAKHGKEFYMNRTRRAQLTIQEKMNKAARKKGVGIPKRGDLLSSAGYPKCDDAAATVDPDHRLPQPSSPWPAPHYQWRPPLPTTETIVAKPMGSPNKSEHELPSPGASRGLRKMFTLLDDHFDTKTGRYVSGWSDQAVANECGLAVSVVVHYREGAYGVLRTVDERTLSEIKRLDAALNDLQAKIGLIRNDLEAVKVKVK